MERNRILNSPIFVALITGILAIIGINNISRLLELWDGSGLYIVATFAFLIMGMALAKFTHKTSSKINLVLCSLAGIVLGVIIDVTLDFFIRHYDRNLFPFEIIMWWIFAPLPILAGVVFQRAREKTNLIPNQEDAPDQKVLR